MPLWAVPGRRHVPPCLLHLRPQLAELIHKIKTNPDDRRLVLSAWNPAALKDMALPPCHMFCQVGAGVFIGARQTL